MKIRALGTGSIFSSLCKNPLMSPCFLVYTEDSVIAIGAPSQLPAKLNEIESLEKLSMIILLSPTADQVSGLFEIGYIYKKLRSKIFLVAPATVMEEVKRSFQDIHKQSLSRFFELRSISKVSFNEEHFSETISLIPNYGGNTYAAKFDSAKILITGAAPLNEDWLHKHFDCEIILHQIDDSDLGATLCPNTEDVQSLPLYIQQKVWLYGYKHTSQVEHPLPMMFLPPYSWVYNSDRKEKALSKKRLISESSVKQF